MVSEIGQSQKVVTVEIRETESGVVVERAVGRGNGGCLPGAELLFGKMGSSRGGWWKWLHLTKNAVTSPSCTLYTVKMINFMLHCSEEVRQVTMTVRNES
jgi:hypothetical protein